MRAPLTSATTLLLLAFALALPGCCFAQAPFKPTQLLAPTSCYLIWRGTPKGEIRQTNALLSFWDDPGSAPKTAAPAAPEGKGRFLVSHIYYILRRPGVLFFSRP
jgi:hypothetical protein